MLKTALLQAMEALGEYTLNQGKIPNAVSQQGTFFFTPKFPKINPQKTSRSQTKGGTDQDKSKPFTPRALWHQRHPCSCGQTVPLGTNRGGSEVPSVLNHSPAPCCLHAHGHSLVGRSAVQARHRGLLV